MKIFRSLFERIRSVLRSALTQGWTASGVSWSAAWGVTLGIFPILGVSTIACGLAAGFGRLNQAVVQGSNYLVGPLKLLLILPCIRVGEWMFPTARPFTLDLEEFSRLFAAAPLETLVTFAASFGHAIVGWALMAPIVMGTSYFLTSTLLHTRPFESMYVKAS